MATELETKMNAVERVVEYMDLPLESNHDTDPNIAGALAPAWPEKGTLQVDGLGMRYRPGLPLVLRISPSRRGEEKLGICGRTGSGKSSLPGAVPHRGARGGFDQDRRRGRHHPWSAYASVEDGDDPSGSFHVCRHRAIEPRSLRRAPDVAIWEVLEKVGLRVTVEDAAKKLEMEVVDNGANFSLGQRQLLCMGRALLRNSRILMMDEATAPVDMDSDALIQRTVREAFAHCTTLTIAHRLNTIMDSDKVAFLDAGRLTEFGEPSDLLKDANGSFTKLVEQSGRRTLHSSWASPTRRRSIARAETTSPRSSGPRSRRIATRDRRKTSEAEEYRIGSADDDSSRVPGGNADRARRSEPIRSASRA